MAFTKTKDSLEKQDGVGKAGTFQSRPVRLQLHPNHSSKVVVNEKRKGMFERVTIDTQIFPNITIQ